MVRAGGLPDSAVRPSAIIAYRASRVVSHDVNAAPAGAFHWWDIGEYGHVAMAIDRRGWSLMASRHVQESWGDAIGITPVDDYTRKTGARYLGWSYDYAGAEVADVRNGPKPGPSPAPTPGGSVPKTFTEQDGVPGANYYKRLQLFAQRNGYSGPLDGAMGKNSWASVQRGLRAYGYNGPDDGVPGANTYKSIQKVAQRYGYSGPIDGEMGKNSYKAFARFLNTL
jgi:peptidoglycan hydrolase-like protein with peptidoglycan-binding domain